MILIDNMFSFKLKNSLRNISKVYHVNELPILKSNDLVIWKYCKEEGLSILTNDSDFLDIQNLRGFPLKLIFLKIGNTSNLRLQEIIQKNNLNIRHFLDDEARAVLVIME